MEIEQIFKQKSKKYLDEIIAIRRHLHQNPELSYEEFETAKYIQETLSKWNISFTSIANTGTLAIIRGKNENKRCIALRADIDALPILEQTSHQYQSKNKGVMHACGHDVHTSCLLGAAKILNETKDEWEGTIKLLFQPGEEKNPGGATYMIRDGALENPKPSGIYGLHVHPGLPLGELSFRSGVVMASTDELFITLNGNGGHAAAPHLTTDLVLIAANIITGVQQIVSRNNSPFNPTVLSFCSIHAGNTTNVIPSELKISGTLRCMNEDWRKQAHLLLNKYIIDIAHAYGAEVSLKIDIGYPMVYNNPQLTTIGTRLAEKYMGITNVSETELRMGAEDFAFYAQKIPGCFYRLGVRNELKGIVNNVHTPVFDVDENAIEYGMGMMAYLGALG